MTNVAKTGVASVSPSNATKSWSRSCASVGIVSVICSSTTCPPATPQRAKVAGAPILVSTRYRSRFFGTFTEMNLVLVDAKTQTGHPKVTRWCSIDQFSHVAEANGQAAAASCMAFRRACMRALRRAAVLRCKMGVWLILSRSRHRRRN